MACPMNYTIQCRDVATGETGCFLFDTEHWQRTGEFLAVSPVFPGLPQFYAWDRENGNLRTSCYLERA